MLGEIFHWEGGEVLEQECRRGLFFKKSLDQT